MSDVSLRRRKFIRYAGLTALGLATWPLGKQVYSWLNPKIHTQWQGITPEIAHQINHTDFPAPQSYDNKQIVIIGSGIAGLSAARYLYRQGVTDFAILELENYYGGNSGSSPMAAHYLPILSPESQFLTEFLQEANIITGFDAQGLPYYNELYLCHDLRERLFLNGTWQRGLIPHYGITNQDENEIDRFFKLMDEYKQARGQDSKPAFSIPITLSSRDTRFLKLDQITMAAFLHEQGFRSPYLMWYLNYCCRDDYGADIEHVSAWAGIHYFAARRTHAANAQSDAILTWPEGNAFLTAHLVKDFKEKIQTQAMVFKIEKKEQFEVQYYDLKTHQSAGIKAEQILLATPRFVANKLYDQGLQTAVDHYSPWLVANITVQGIQDLAWDNVSYYSRSLGFIDNAHQHLNTHEVVRTLSYYLPLDELDPSSARKQALTKTDDAWRAEIIEDLEKIHPGIRRHILNIDYKVLGHGMIRPTPGQVWSRSVAMPRVQDGVFYAHSDMSGISIFEEAFWQGVETAKVML